MRLPCLALSVLVLSAIGAAWPAPARAQTSLTVLADSARRLDSLVRTIRPSPDSRPQILRLRLEAAELYRRAGDRQREGAMRLAAAPFFDDRDSSQAYVHAALALAREAGDREGEGNALQVLLGRHTARSQLDSAVAYGREAALVAREQGERWSGGRMALYQLGHAYWRLGRLDSAEAYYREAMQAARQTGERPVELLATGDLGNVYGQRGQIDSSFKYQHAALAGFRTDGDRVYEAVWLSNIGIVHNDLGRADSALVYFRQSLAIAQEMRIAQLAVAARVNMGVAMMRLGQVDSAAAYFSGVVARAREMGNRDDEANALGNLGDALRAVGKLDSALVVLRQALGILHETGARYDLAAALETLGKVHVAQGRPDSALAAYVEGLRVAREGESAVSEIEILRRLGELHGRGADLARAVAYYDSAWAVRTRTTASASADQHRVSFAETGTELLERWTLTWLARTGEIGERQSALAALAVAERGRAQALLAMLRRGQAGDSATTAAARPQRAGADLVREGRELAASTAAAGAPVLAYLATKDTLLVWLVLPSGEVIVSRAAVPRDSAARLVAAARAELGVDVGGERAMSLLDAEDTTADTTHGALATVGAVARLTALSLPAALVRRLPSSGELIVVAHGPLALVPFAALPVDGTADRTLGTRHAIRYTPSLSTLRTIESATVRAGALATAAPTRALVVGNPTMPRVRTRLGRPVRLLPLPAAEREARSVASALAVTPLTGGEATERTVRGRLGEASIVHLATHGFAFSSDARALDSFIALAADSAAGATTDGLLTVGEVLDQVPRFSADLVVLSACQTGLGNLKQAEGTVGLQRAFLAKGARSVLVSLWSVSDEATELLMRRFYEHWLQDQDKPVKAEALRRAQRDVQRTPRFREPRYWAAFQLVGAR